MTRFRRIVTVISLILFSLSMVLPALGFEKICGSSDYAAGLFNEPNGSLEKWYGAKILLHGLFGAIVMPTVSFGWLANPLYFAAMTGWWFFRKYSRYAGLIALVGLFIGISGTFWTVNHGLLVDEGGICRLYLNDLYVGFWLWAAAQSVIVLSVFVPNKSVPTPLDQG